ncbi:MAG: xanthine dehydrogenase family protein subunit M [Acidobacteria bacterium]|nr:xanthine dehydrogenase family protein subunit M [Acidobacteriota bacterium]
MPILHDFDYVKPLSVVEAVGVLAVHGAAAAVLAGGTDLVGWMRDELATPRMVVDVKGIPELRGIARQDGFLRIGAAVTFNELRESPEVRREAPVLWEAAGRVGSCGLRNRATLAGNICSAIPCCDGGPSLLALDAVVDLAGPSGARTIAIPDWFIEKRRTAKADTELVTSVRLPLPSGPHGGSFIKLGRYRGEDLAQASVAVLALPGHVRRVAFGAVAVKPFRALKLEALLAGKPLTDALVEEAKTLLSQEIAPITDVRATREYRSLATAVMLERALRAAETRLEGKGPDYGTPLI